MQWTAIDFETVRTDDKNVVPRPICLSYYNSNKEKGILLGSEIEPFLFSLKDQLVIAHNMSFELSVIARHYPKLIDFIYEKLEKGEIYCTLIYEKLLNLIRQYPKKKMSLAYLVYNYFDIDIFDTKGEDTWRLNYDKLENVKLEDWPQDAIDYAINDSIYAAKVYLQQKKAKSLEYKEHLKAIFTLNLMAKSGFEVDSKKVAKLESEIQKILEPTYKHLLETGILYHSEEKYKINQPELKEYLERLKIDNLKYTTHGISISKANLLKYKEKSSDEILNLVYEFTQNKKISQKLLDKNILLYEPAKIKKKTKKLEEFIKSLKLERYIYTEKGSLSTSADSLKIYNKEAEHETLKHLTNLSKYEDMLSKYIANLKKADPYIYCEYNTPVDTGRTSCTGSKFYPSLNLQNQPRGIEGTSCDIRNCYIPPKGFKICSIDYKFLELASCASQLLRYYGKSKMADAVNYGDEPADLHSIYSAFVMSTDLKRKVSYEEFISNIKDEKYKKYRQKCKAANLSFPGGIGYDALGIMMRKQGVNTQFKILATAKWEDQLKYAYKKMKPDYPRLRIARLSKWEYALVLDEIVEMKRNYLNLYPELETFLKEDHKQFFQYKNGKPETMKIKNEYGEYEDEQMYTFYTHGIFRKYATYTKICNGYLMQIPGACGAKDVMYQILKKYFGHLHIKPLAFIHDEFVFAYREGQEEYIYDIAKIMVEVMSQHLPGVKISVEADYNMPYWMKELGEKTFTMYKPSEQQIKVIE